MSARWHMAALLVGLVMVAGFSVVSCAAEAPPVPAPPCNDFELQISVTTCDGGECAEQQVCAWPCWEGRCLEGRACDVALPGEEPRFCSLQCDSALCPGTQECSSPEGGCLDVACGLKLPCTEAGDFCAMGDHECYPLSGLCSSEASCPGLDERTQAVGEVACVQGYCRLAAKATPPVKDLSAEDPVTLLAPVAGTSFSDTSALAIHWEGPQGAALVLILRERPTTKEEVKTLAIWGAALPKGSQQEITLDQGSAIQDGVWLSSPVELPTNTPLYVLVQVVDGAKLLGVSVPVPFSIGAAWKGPRGRCQDGESPDSCANPSLPLACHEGQCRVLCASHRDCAPWGQKCGPPRDGIRFCE